MQLSFFRMKIKPKRFENGTRTESQLVNLVVRMCANIHKPLFVKYIGRASVVLIASAIIFLKAPGADQLKF